MKTMTSEALEWRTTFSQESEMRVERAVDAFMKGIEQLLLEEVFLIPQTMDFAKKTGVDIF